MFTINHSKISPLRHSFRGIGTDPRTGCGYPGKRSKKFSGILEECINFII